MGDSNNHTTDNRNNRNNRNNRDNRDNRLDLHEASHNVGRVLQLQNKISEPKQTRSFLRGVLK